jgi:hypothetical protein
MKLVCFGLLLVLCQPAEKPVPSRVTVAVCPVVAPWSADYQKRLAAELRKLPPGSAIENAIAETLSLRDQARACEEVNRTD